MTDIALSDRQQRALRSLLAAEAVPGAPLPDRHVLGQVVTLVPCDSISVTLADATGYPVDFADLHGRGRPSGPPASYGPLPLGLQWASREPALMRRLLGHGTDDLLLLGYRNGPDHVVQVALDRHARLFTRRDVAVLRLIEPVLGRLLSEPPAPHLPPELTVQERRILRLVAEGHSNTEIADRIGVAVCTVRKHLEHAFPKLGVTNRLAAVRAFEGVVAPDPDPRALVSGFA
jgi:DNA-binding CsgD family transcriptional regulator